MIDLSLTFDDIALVPAYNNIDSRTEPDISAWLTKNTKMNIPILASNMDTVIGDNLADVLIKHGSIPIFHRFYKEEETVLRWINKYHDKAFFSAGIIDKDQLNFLLMHNVKGVVLDVAHGHSSNLMKTISWLKHKWSEVEVIAGNVCTPSGYIDLVNAGADAVKVGIGPGAACTTRLITGFGVPQFSAIMSIGEEARKYRVPFIADGGIRGSGDIVKALAAGASSVMIGKMFAATDESVAPKAKSNDGKLKVYRGQASAAFQEDYYGGMKVGTVPEGAQMVIYPSGPASNLISNLLGGIRSGMTYGGARNIHELQRKFKYVRVTPSYLVESNIRINNE